MAVATALLLKKLAGLEMVRRVGDDVGALTPAQLETLELEMIDLLDIKDRLEAGARLMETYEALVREQQSQIPQDIVGRRSSPPQVDPEMLEVLYTRELSGLRVRIGVMRTGWGARIFPGRRVGLGAGGHLLAHHLMLGMAPPLDLWSTSAQANAVAWLYLQPNAPSDEEITAMFEALGRHTTAEVWWGVIYEGQCLDPNGFVHDAKTRRRVQR